MVISIILTHYTYGKEKERKKNTKQNKSGPRHEACLYIKTESPNAYNDT